MSLREVPLVDLEPRTGRDFVDWAADLMTSRNVAVIRGRKQRKGDRPSLTTLIRAIAAFFFDSSQAWLAAAAVGVACGILAALVEVSTHWVGDLKRGVCVDFYWASEFLCCVSENQSDAVVSSSWDGGAAITTCQLFRSWSSLVSDDSLGLFGFFMYSLFAVALATTSAFLCFEYAPFAAGSGIMEVKTILSGVHLKGFLDAPVGFVKSVGLCLSVGSGLTLGKEGPFVHLGCCVAQTIGRLFPHYRTNEVAIRELISTGAAAGVAVAFGAPIGGVLFSLEEVSLYFPHRVMLQSFFCATISTLVLRKIDPTHTGRIVQFAVAYRHVWHWFELSAFCLLGVLGGLVGASFVALNQRVMVQRKKLKLHPVREIAALAFVTAVVSYSHPFLRRSMTDVLSALFEDCTDRFTGTCYSQESWVAWELIVAGVIKLLLMVVTFGTAVPAGCFVPSLFIGACFGRAVGTIVKGLQYRFHDAAVFSSCAEAQQCIVPGVYAIVGAAAVLAGVTRMTLCLVVIMMELTGGLDYVVPCMLAAMIASWTADLLGVGSVYEYQAEAKNLPFIDHKIDFDSDTTVGDALLSKKPQPIKFFSEDHSNPHRFRVAVMWEKMTLGDVARVSRANMYRYFPVVDAAPRPPSATDHDRGEWQIIGDYIGAISREVILQALRRAAAIHLDDDTLVSFTAQRADEETNMLTWRGLLTNFDVRVQRHMPMAHVVTVFHRLGMHFVVVLDGPKLIGIFTRKDVVRFVHMCSRGSGGESIFNSVSTSLGSSNRLRRMGGATRSVTKLLQTVLAFQSAPQQRPPDGE